MYRKTILVATVLLLGAFLRTPAPAQCPFAEDIGTRPTLTGNWGGIREDLEEKGVKYDASVTQIGQGVMSGGKDGTWEYGARGNITMNLDTQKLNLWPGGFFTLEMEGNWDDAVNGKTGALMPVNMNHVFPWPGESSFNVPNLSYAQFLSHYAGVLVGKLDTTSGDENAFAHGKGDSQFFNLAFNLNPVTLVATPYSTLGAGAIILPTKDHHEAIVKLLVLSATGKPSTSGFESLSSDNLTFVGEGRVRTDFFGLTGHQLLGLEYANRTYTSLDQRLGDILDDDLAKKSDTWALFYNFDQFLYETDKEKGQGLGLFGRFGTSDGSPNLMQYFFSVGVGGKGVVPGRESDRFGIGYYYLNIDGPTLSAGPRRTRTALRDEWGFEAFYNVEITPWMLLTPDIQVVGPAQKKHVVDATDPENLVTESVGLATILGFRLQLIF